MTLAMLHVRTRVMISASQLHGCDFKGMVNTKHEQNRVTHVLCKCIAKTCRPKKWL